MAYNICYRIYNPPTRYHLGASRRKNRGKKKKIRRILKSFNRDGRERKSAGKMAP